MQVILKTFNKMIFIIFSIQIFVYKSRFSLFNHTLLNDTQTWNHCAFDYKYNKQTTTIFTEVMKLMVFMNEKIKRPTWWEPKVNAHHNYGCLWLKTILTIKLKGFLRYSWGWNFFLSYWWELSLVTIKYILNLDLILTLNPI